MVYDFKCKECDEIFENTMKLVQYESWLKGIFPMTCPNCNNRTSDYERVFPKTVGLKFVGNWFSNKGHY